MATAARVRRATTMGVLCLIAATGVALAGIQMARAADRAEALVDAALLGEAASGADTNQDGVTTIDEIVSASRGDTSVEADVVAIPRSGHGSGPAVVVGSAVARPGQTVTIGVVVRNGGYSVSGMQNDIQFDPQTRIVACRKNPAFGFSYSRLIGSPACLGTPNCVRSIYIDFDFERDYELIADGARIYECDVTVAAHTPPGSYPLLISNFIFATPLGSRIPGVTGESGVVVVPEPDSDCGNGILDAGEDCDDGNTAYGDCCSGVCSFESAGSVCRVAREFCDAPEVCGGTGAECPPDESQPDGVICVEGSLFQCTTEPRCISGTCDLAANEDTNFNGICDSDDGGGSMVVSHLALHVSKPDRPNGFARFTGEFSVASEDDFRAALLERGAGFMVFDNDHSFSFAREVGACAPRGKSAIECGTREASATFRPAAGSGWQVLFRARNLGTADTGLRIDGRNPLAAPAHAYMRAGGLYSYNGSKSFCSRIYNRILSCR